MNFVSTIFGAALCGIVVAGLLLGLLSMQVWMYFHKYPNDMIYIKLLVSGLWALEVFQLGTTTHMIYTYLITDFGEIAELTVAAWDWALYLGLTAIAAGVVQAFFVHRIHILTQSWQARWVVTSIISAISLCQTAFGLSVMAEAFKLKFFENFTAYTWGLDVWLACAVAADILIAGTMCFFLHTNRTGIMKTDLLINKLMAYSVQTGAITSIAEIISLATFTTLGFNWAHVFISFPLGSLYAVSLLANLNARQSSQPNWRSVTQTAGTTNVVELSAVSGGGSHALPRATRVPEGEMKFAVGTTTTTTMYDDVNTKHTMDSYDRRSDDRV